MLRLLWLWRLRRAKTKRRARILARLIEARLIKPRLIEPGLRDGRRSKTRRHGCSRLRTGARSDILLVRLIEWVLLIRRILLLVLLVLLNLLNESDELPFVVLLTAVVNLDRLVFVFRSDSDYSRGADGLRIKGAGLALP